ncbi:DUF2059 domain-containing protein [Corallincola spongiicola]|uniref:DUF2059 domain-containing protein n=2 Tax=Psychromonadaceae TaxID=267894 RepID=A0ABY1WP92_9GAMM|nr:DUF2059 domain-containing protein [Corallincola spongiicola]TAA45903.1 DUF2059 domain-containing protein [Corallincola spongiicola]
MSRYLVIFCTLFFVFSASIKAETDTDSAIPAEKRAAIMKLMEITGSDQMGKMFADMFIKQSAAAMQLAYPDIPARAIDVIADEVNQVVDEEVAKGELQRSLMPVYHRHFTLEELNVLLAFYESPTGQKSIRIMPQLTQESTLIGQAWAQQLSGKLQLRLSQRFQQEGLLPSANKPAATE